MDTRGTSDAAIQPNGHVAILVQLLGDAEKGLQPILFALELTPRALHYIAPCEGQVVSQGRAVIVCPKAKLDSSQITSFRNDSLRRPA